MRVRAGLSEPLLIAHTTLLEISCRCSHVYPLHNCIVLLDFSLTVKASPHECVIRTSQPKA